MENYLKPLAIRTPLRMDSFSTSERIVPVVFLLFSLVVGFKVRLLA